MSSYVDLLICSKASAPEKTIAGSERLNLSGVIILGNLMEYALLQV
jgi:hypothetical protein